MNFTESSTRFTRRTLISGAAAMGFATLTACAGSTPAGGGSPNASGRTTTGPTTAPVPAKPAQLSLNTFGGVFQDNMQKYVATPFEQKYGIKVQLVTTAPPLATLQAQGSNPEIDLFIAGDPQRMLAEQQGLLQPYDPSVVSNAADLYPQARKSDAACVINYASQGLVYDTTKLKAPPTSWFDLFDLDLPNQVVVRAPDAQNTVSWLALMAHSLNGAWPSKLSDYGKVLDLVATKLKPNLFAAVPNESGMREALTGGQGVLGVWQDSQVVAANAAGGHLGYAEPKEGPLPIATMVALTQTPNKYWAAVLMNTMLDPEGQSGWATNGGYGPSNTKAKVDAGLASKITYGPDKIDALVQLPWKDLVPLNTDLAQKFNAAIGAG